MSYKADISSVSPSSERKTKSYEPIAMSDLECICMATIVENVVC